jgi:pyruvate/oxaloacetate carboxyltransferase
MRKIIPALRSLTDASTLENVTRQVSNMEQATTKGDVLEVALASVEAYRFLENAMDPASRSAPLEVAMLDYSGFKLSILSKKEVTDWQSLDVSRN